MKKIVCFMLFVLALMLAGCEKSAQEKLAEKTLKEKEAAEAWGEAYKKQVAKESEELLKKYGKK